MATAGSAYPTCKATGRCAATGRGFESNERYVATLTEQTGVPGFARVDFSVDAWAQGARPAAPARVIGSWRTAYQPEQMVKSPLLGDQEMLDLFEDLGAATDDRQVRFRYLLALLLIRRRQLRVVGTRRVASGAVLSVVRRGEEVPAGGQRATMEVVDPGLDEATIAEAIDQLGLLVEGDGGGAPTQSSGATK